MSGEEEKTHSHRQLAELEPRQARGVSRRSGAARGSELGRHVPIRGGLQRAHLAISRKARAADSREHL